MESLKSDNTYCPLLADKAGNEGAWDTKDVLKLKGISYSNILFCCVFLLKS